MLRSPLALIRRQSAAALVLIATGCSSGATPPDTYVLNPARVSIELTPAPKPYYDVGDTVRFTTRAYDAMGREMAWSVPRRLDVLDTSVIQLRADDTFTTRRVGSSWMWVVWRANLDVRDSVAIKVGVRGVGTIVFSNIEGGCWLIQTDPKTVYEPTNLPSAFKVSGLRVRFAAGPSGYGSLCMAGRIIDLDSIRVEPPT